MKFFKYFPPILIAILSMFTFASNSFAQNKPFADLPLHQAVKVVYGNGARSLVTFEDPNCGYCRKLNAEFVSLNNVTVYTFMVSFLGEKSAVINKKIWCSKNKSDAWVQWMINRVEPVAENNCDTNALTANNQLASKFKINGTPYIIFPNGGAMSGFRTASKLEGLLAQ